MANKSYERYRQQLEKQLRADVKLLYSAFCAKLRAFEAMQHLNGTVEDFNLDLLVSADLPLSLLNAGEQEEPEKPAVPAPAAPPAPAPKPRKTPFALHFAVTAALDKVPKVFDRGDLVAALGYKPKRSSLHRVLHDLVSDGAIAIVEGGLGRIAHRYRKLSPPSAEPPAKNE